MVEAKFPLFNEEHSDLKHFKLHLAAYCNKYVMEIAKPIMQRANELFNDKAIVCLVDKWFEANEEYERRRKAYLVQWAEYDPADECAIRPFDSFTWEKNKVNAYKEALDALLVR